LYPLLNQSRELDQSAAEDNQKWAKTMGAFSEPFNKKVDDSGA
jgi:hypothetical protein